MSCELLPMLLLLLPLPLLLRRPVSLPALTRVFEALYFFSPCPNIFLEIFDVFIAAVRVKITRVGHWPTSSMPLTSIVYYYGLGWRKGRYGIDMRAIRGI